MIQDFHAVAHEFFNEQGWSVPATLKKQIGSSYDVNTSQTITVEQSYDVLVILFDYMSKSEGSVAQKDSLIKTGDKQVFMKPTSEITSVDPTTDKLTVGDTTYNVIAVKEFNPNLSGVVYYELYVRV